MASNPVSSVNELVAAKLIEIDDPGGLATFIRRREFWTIAIGDVEQDAEIEFGTFPKAWTARPLRCSGTMAYPEARLVRRLEGTP